MRVVDFCLTVAVVAGAVGALFLPIATVAVAELESTLRLLATV